MLRVRARWPLTNCRWYCPLARGSNCSGTVQKPTEFRLSRAQPCILQLRSILTQHSVQLESAKTGQERNERWYQWHITQHGAGMSDILRLLNVNTRQDETGIILNRKSVVYTYNKRVAFEIITDMHNHMFTCDNQHQRALLTPATGVRPVLRRLKIGQCLLSGRCK